MVLQKLREPPARPVAWPLAFGEGTGDGDVTSSRARMASASAGANRLTTPSAMIGPMGLQIGHAEGARTISSATCHAGNLVRPSSGGKEHNGAIIGPAE